jgi:hypothetical protein
MAESVVEVSVKEERQPEAIPVSVPRPLVFLPSRVKYQINGDFVENPQKLCKTCEKHHIA